MDWEIFLLDSQVLQLRLPKAPWLAQQNPRALCVFQVWAPKSPRKHKANGDRPLVPKAPWHGLGAAHG